MEGDEEESGGEGERRGRERLRKGYGKEGRGPEKGDGKEVRGPEKG